MRKICVGIDIAKKNFVAAIQINDKTKIKTFTNNENGFKNLISWVKKLSEGQYHFCMEATGKYGDKLALFLYDNNHLVSVVNPAKIKFFAKSQLSRNKTDAADAKLIWHYCILFNPRAWRPIPIEIQSLQELVKRLDSLVKMKLQEQNRLENVAEIVSQSINNHISHLGKKIKKMEEKIKNHIDSYPHLKEKAELLESIPGIGLKTKYRVLAFLSSVEDFEKAKQLAAFVGLTPEQSQSGTSLNHCSLSKKGDSDLRKMLYMPALVAIKFNPIMKAFYKKLRGKGKLKMVCICAVMRKLVHIIYGVLKSNKPFDAKLV